MKSYLRRAAAVVLAAALLVPSIAGRPSPSADRGRTKAELVRRVIEKVKRAFRVSADSDVLSPPAAPAPPNPPSTTT